MSFVSDDSQQTQQLRTMQIIVIAMVGGAAVFTAIAIYTQTAGLFPPPAQPLLTYIAPAASLVQLALLVLVPRLAVAAQRRRIAQTKWRLADPDRYRPPFDENGALWGLYQNRLIIQLAFLEGACFFLLIAYMIEGTIACLMLALLFLCGMAVLFPLRERVERWVEIQRELIAEERLGAGL